MTPIPELVVVGNELGYMHFVLSDRLLACCDVLHSSPHHRCDVADNWVLVRPGLHSSHATP